MGTIRQTANLVKNAKSVRCRVPALPLTGILAGVHASPQMVQLRVEKPGDCTYARIPWESASDTCLRPPVPTGWLIPHGVRSALRVPGRKPHQTRAVPPRPLKSTPSAVEMAPRHEKFDPVFDKVDCPVIEVCAAQLLARRCVPDSGSAARTAISRWRKQIAARGTLQGREFPADVAFRWSIDG